MTERKSGCLLVAAIQIGATHSGYAFSMRHDFEVDPLKIQTNQDRTGRGTQLVSWTPTSLLLDANRKFVAFGYEAENIYTKMEGQQNDYFFFHRFEMSLHSNTKFNSHIIVEDINGKTVLAVDVFALIIRAIVDNVIHRLGCQGTGVRPNEIQWVLTVPVQWIDNSKEFMRESAIQAGLQQDKLFIIKEPKAAFIFSQYLPVKITSNFGFTITAGTKHIVMVDLDSTVEVAVYESLIGGGEKNIYRAARDVCGGTSIDYKLIQLFENVLGKTFLNTMKRTYLSSYLDLLREIEAIKSRITSTTKKINIPVPYPTLDRLCQQCFRTDFLSMLTSSYPSSTISMIHDKIRIDAELFNSFFDKTLKCILELLQDMIERREFRTVTLIILLGSIFEYEIVLDKIRKAFPTKRIVRPKECDLSTVKGAVLYGHTKLSDLSDSGQQLFTEFQYIPFGEDTLENTIYGEMSPPSFLSADTRELSTDIPYVPFDEDILDNFDYTKRAPPTLFTTDVRGYHAAQPVISETAKKTCETILVGFEMATTDIILLHGDINMDCYNQTVNAARMKQDIERNKKLWMNQSTTAAIRLGQVHGVLNAINTKNYTDILKLYYRSQHQHTLTIHNKPVEIPVFIYRNQLESSWETALDNAITSINTATPGINLFETRDINESMIHIGVHTSKGPTVACTMYGHIMQKPGKFKPFIHLGQQWNTDARYGTSIHELMHALSFNHEMQRFDSDMYLKINKNADHNYKIKADRVLTRFDPFSIMMYPMIEMEKKDGDPIWNLKDDGNQCQELSELNKVALNLVYQPCINKSKNFSPQLSIQTGMLYCGRPVMKTHNQVGKGTTDGFCGPNNWANCAACRVVTRIKDKDNKSKQIPKLEACLQKGKWQGLSGLFYCGKQDAKFATDLKFVKSDRKCGPDNGLPCNDCGKELFNDYRIAFFDI